WRHRVRERRRLRGLLWRKGVLPDGLHCERVVPQDWRSRPSPSGSADECSSEPSFLHFPRLFAEEYGKLRLQRSLEIGLAVFRGKRAHASEKGEGVRTRPSQQILALR